MWVLATYGVPFAAASNSATRTSQLPLPPAVKTLSVPERDPVHVRHVVGPPWPS